MMKSRIKNHEKPGLRSANPAFKEDMRISVLVHVWLQDTHVALGFRNTFYAIGTEDLGFTLFSRYL